MTKGIKVITSEEGIELAKDISSVNGVSVCEYNECSALQMNNVKELFDATIRIAIAEMDKLQKN